MSESPKWQWDAYYKHNPQEPRVPLLKALELFEQEKHQVLHKTAIDIGCGHGPDTLELLKRGWNVLAIDGEKDGLELIKSSISPEQSEKLELQQSVFEGLKLRPVTLINASLSLPFCKPDNFSDLWSEIEKSIICNGRFAGNLFGEKDSWAVFSNMTFHTKQDVNLLFQNFYIEHFEEREYDGFASGGYPKHWHYYNIVSKKK